MRSIGRSVRSVRSVCVKKDRVRSVCKKIIRVIREIRVQKIIRVQNKIRGYGSPRYSIIALTWWAMKYLELRR